MSTSLKLLGVRKRYPGQEIPAVDGVDLKLAPGRILALLGESGSGKTTLLRLISGLEQPDQGEIFLGERCVASDQHWVSPEQRKIGLVFQQGALFPHLNVEQNICYGLKGIPKGEQRKRTQALLVLVGLDGMQKRYPHELSGGERQRVAVVRALAPEPDLLLMDEPFSHLDPGLRHGLRREFHLMLQELGCTVVLVTHDAEDALRMGDEIAVFRNGLIEQQGSPADLFHRPVNRYCALLFGPAGQVGGRWIRPEDLEISPVYVPESYPAVIEDWQDVGRGVEVQLRLQEAEQELCAVLCSSAEGLKRGSSAWVRCRTLPAQVGD